MSERSGDPNQTKWSIGV